MTKLALGACLLLVMLALAGAPAASASAAPRLLVLDFELVDTSGEPVDRAAEHARRLARVRDAISESLAREGRYEIVDRRAIRADLDALLEHQYLRSCNGCELPLARRAAADLVMLGKFNKISTLIGSMDIVVKDANSGAVVYAQTFGYRGDTDEAWLRAAKFFAEAFRREAQPGPRKTP